jgi:threonine dehydrogenase-like Zn-dependent dehydrogenase
VIRHIAAHDRGTRACTCGRDLWPFEDLEPGEPPRLMAHEAVGLVDAVGPEVRTVNTGDVVVMPFAFSDGTCDYCAHGLQTGPFTAEREQGVPIRNADYAHRLVRRRVGIGACSLPPTYVA